MIQRNVRLLISLKSTSTEALNIILGFNPINLHLKTWRSPRKHKLQPPPSSPTLKK